jgi:hypothetical protein
MLAADPGPLRMLQTEEYTCQLLDVVDEIVLPEASVRITDAIYDRLAGEAAREAAERIVQAYQETDRLTAVPFKISSPRRS